MAHECPEPAHVGYTRADAARVKARFIEPMLLLRTDALPDDGARWEYQLKLDGYRADRVQDRRQAPPALPQRQRFQPPISGRREGLAKLPDDTVIDGEVVALDEEGRPSFNLLQNYGSVEDSASCYFVFDVMVLGGRDVMREPLTVRRELLETKVLPKLAEPVRYAAPLDASLRCSCSR